MVSGYSPDDPTPDKSMPTTNQASEVKRNSLNKSDEDVKLERIEDEQR